MADPREVTARELEYHERLYSGFAQQHFARPAVVEFRRDLVRRLLRATGAAHGARVLSLGCGIGDTELLLAREVGEVVGIDLSPKAIAQAREDAARQSIANARFELASWRDFSPGERFDVVVAIFFLHHLPADEREALARRLHRLLAPGGVFFSLDPSARRLAGWIGNLLAPKLMKRYESPDEQPLKARAAAAELARAGLSVQTTWYDFVSTPVAGLCPGWTVAYRLSRLLDDVVVRVPLLRALGGNFALIARVS